MTLVNRYIESCDNLPELDGLAVWEVFMCPEALHTVVEKDWNKEWFSQNYDDIDYAPIKKMKKTHKNNIKKMLLQE